MVNFRYIIVNTLYTSENKGDGDDDDDDNGPFCHCYFTVIVN